MNNKSYVPYPFSVIGVNVATKSPLCGNLDVIVILKNSFAQTRHIERSSAEVNLEINKHDSISCSVAVFTLFRR